MHPSRLSSFKRNIGGRECALRATRRARTTLVLPEGDESGDDFFLKLSPTRPPICEKKKEKKREEREIISKIVGTTIVSRSGIFFIVFRSNFENGDDEAEEK